MLSKKLLHCLQYKSVTAINRSLTHYANNMQISHRDPRRFDCNVEFEGAGRAVTLIADPLRFSASPIFGSCLQFRAREEAGDQTLHKRR